MCGIAGFVGTTPLADRDAVIGRMTRAMARRGPDGEGQARWPTAGLGHRRLSIFDLSEAGSQPMLSADGSIGVVFNGAIYNFHALRAELESAGFVFRSETDTEVLVHGYQAWGIDELVSRLRGMFAFAVWDDPRQTLFLVRDRLGVKPLLYAERNRTIAFASTAAGLLPALPSDALDEQAVAEFLEFGYVTEDRTIYRDALKLPAAHILWWQNGKSELRRYWQVSDVDERHAPSFEQAVEETERLFLQAVEMRLQADVPVGALLSGGVDSSLVCWAIAKLGGSITAYTVGTPGDALDETGDAVETARTLGLAHRVLAMRPEDEPGLDTLVAAYGEPFACASALGMLRVSQAVRETATVLLTGDGGDDVFLGYPTHQHLWKAQQVARRLPSLAFDSWASVRKLVPQVGTLKRAAHFLDYSTGGLGAVNQAHDGWPVYQKRHILGDRLRGLHLPQREIPWSPGSARRVLTDWLGYHYGGQFVSEYLTKVDGATMYHGLEARAPFLDQALWTFASALPYGTRLHGGASKALLRELARRHLGERVGQGAKRGFHVPVQRWIAGRWKPLVEEAFQSSLLAASGWVNDSAVRALLRESAAQQRAPQQLWYLFVLECWLRYQEYGAISLTAAHAA